MEDNADPDWLIPRLIAAGVGSAERERGGRHAERGCAHDDGVRTRRAEKAQAKAVQAARVAEELAAGSVR